MNRTTHSLLMHAKMGLIAVLALLIAACGKQPNVHREILLDFPNVLPERPVKIDTPHAESWTSGRAMAVHADSLYVLDRRNGDLVVMDRHDLSVSYRVALGGGPEQITVGPDGTQWVTLRDAGDVVRIAPGAKEVATKRALGHEPFGIALAPSGMASLIYVTLAAENKLLALDPVTLVVMDEVDVFEDPRGLAVSFNGVLTLTHSRDTAIQMGLDNKGTFKSLHHSLLRRGNPSDHLLETGRLGRLTPSRSLAASINPSDGSALIAHVQVAPGTEEDLMDLPSPGDDASESGGDGGYGSSSRGVDFNLPIRPIETSVTSLGAPGDTNELEAIPPVQDPLTGEPMAHLIDSPSDINHHPTHTLALVTGEGSDNVLVLNTRGQDPMSSPVGEIKVGMAPRAVAFSSDGLFAYVLNDQDFTIAKVDMTPFFDMPRMNQKQLGVQESGFMDGGCGAGSDCDFAFAVPMPEEVDETEEGSDGKSQPVLRVENGKHDVTRPITLEPVQVALFGEDPRDPQVRRGERVFTFARSERMSHAGMFSCATCHLEGREDKLVWMVPEGPRQTPSLAGRLKGTGPFNWNGSKGGLQDNMVQTVTRLGGLGLSTTEREDLEVFLVNGLRVPRNPYLSPEGLNPEQALGKELFNDPDIGCATCHSGPDYTDGKHYDVGTASESEKLLWNRNVELGQAIKPSAGTFNTPGLVGLWYSAPYLHDGSARTLMDVLDMTATTMGHTAFLSQEEKRALVSYLLTL